MTLATDRKRARLSFARLHPLVLGLALLLGADAVTAQIRTVIVSPVPGDQVASGTALRNALAGISSPSATNRWLLKIEPGTYDVGATSLVMRPYVDIEGSGIDTTTILGHGDASGYDNATIQGAENTELRLLTVAATGPSSTSSTMAMANYSASPRLYRVKFMAQGQLVWGVRNVNAVPLIEECEVAVAATAKGSFAYGLVFRGYPPDARRSAILRSKIAVWGATTNYGVYLGDALSLTSIRDSRIDVSGGSTAQGLYAVGVGGWSGVETLTVRNTEIYSSGGASASYGVRFDQAPIVISVQGSTIWGHAAPTSYGIYTDSFNAPGGIQGSSIAGSTKTVQFGGSISITSTYLQGGPVTAGGWVGCAGVWDENLAFYTQACPP